MPTVTNIGILAHVDAGKTSLTERILFHAGVISAIGDVNHGTTQTDTLALERQRGISIQSAVTSFPFGNRIFNLIDTPGHPDFIAEVERVIGVLDAVILVISAVEGVQPQTRRLSRAITNLGLPCLIFANKIDRAGARTGALIAEIERELERDILPLSCVTDVGERDATSVPVDFYEQRVMEDAVNVLSRHDGVLLDRYVESNGNPGEGELRTSLRQQLAAGVVTPILFGSAVTGAGIPHLLDALTELTPASDVDPRNTLAAEVFKVQRLPGGERVLICRIWQGEMTVRSLVPVLRPGRNAEADIPDGKITGIDLYRDGTVTPIQTASTGDMVRVHGLADARIGDWLGEVLRERVMAFEPAVFESRINAVNPGQRVEFNSALAELEDQDPFIAIRRDAQSGETYLRLFGEVQREVVEATLQDDYGVDVLFGERTVLCVERLLGEGHAAEIYPDTKPPFYATVGFRISPKRGGRESWTFTPGKAKQGFFDAAEAGGRSVLEQGLYGWPIIDRDVVVTDLIYLVTSVPVDYRHLAMLVMADAVKAAGTVVCEPVHEVTVRVPLEQMGGVIHALSAHRGAIGETSLTNERAVVRGTIPAAELDSLTRELPGLTNGRADLDSRFSDYVAIQGDPPIRSRTDLNPFNRTEFLSRLRGRF